MCDVETTLQAVTSPRGFHSYMYHSRIFSGENTVPPFFFVSLEPGRMIVFLKEAATGVTGTLSKSG